ncbi:MAG: DegT/DnrJ/EryC1/StrS family aminotransferase [Pelolinea sp.]|nr:DegT/DnrJ/EryC1/StrS family aminotransferase [Pelolinea sp.]
MIRLTVPYVDHRELEEIEKVLQTGFYTQGPKVAEFEKKVADLVGSHYAYAMSSCTTALQLALHTLELKPGDEVLVADYTFPATANIVVTEGQTPVLVDINLDTFSMDPDDLESKITDRSRVIIPVHAFGCSADMNPILEIAKKHDLFVIEDAACALATTYYEKYCGTMGTLGCYSFHPRKAITTGEGGMIVTDKEELAQKIGIFRNHGGVKGEYFYHYDEAGFNYRLSDIQGAMGVAQLEKLDWILENKRRLAAILREKLQGIEGVTPPIEPAWGGHVYQSFVVLLDDGIDRDAVIHSMREKGVETTLGTYAVHAQPYFIEKYGYKPGHLPKSYQAFTQSLTLPLYPQMEDGILHIVVDILKEVIKENIN